MNDKNELGEWQLKDTVVAVPLVASALAITRQVGAMSSLGGFALFTVSEHLLWALGALPMALMYTIGRALVLATLNFAHRAFPKKLVWLRYPLGSTIGLLCIIGLALIADFTLAFEHSTRNIKRLQPDSPIIADIVLKSGTTIKAYVVMIGERGVLFYEPGGDTMTYRKMDDVEQFHWRPLVRK
jgi:lysylphosphatidylglycerol synthetase-like protein (DUF2156 family)